MRRPVFLLVFLSACGGEPGPRPNEAPIRFDASSSPADAGVDAGPGFASDAGVIVDPINRGWIGGACSDARDCAYADSVCLTGDFPSGMCTLPCTQVCPDLEGPNNTQTFCVAAASSDGTCVSRCDHTLLPATGCRDGYGCVAVPRKNEPDRIEEVCLPGAEPLNFLQPALERAAIAAEMFDQRLVLIDVTDPAAPILASLRRLEPVYPASVIKVVVMAEAEHQISEGRLTLDTEFTLTEEQETCDSIPSGDMRPELFPGDSVPVEHLIELMITRSDNSATNLLIDNLGRQNMTAYMASLGLSTLRVHRKVFGCEPYDDSGWDGMNLNTMTALETALLYGLILDGGPGFVGEESRLRMQAVLGRQMWRNKIAAGLPADAVFLSKTGDTSTTVHDSGIILWQGQRYLVAAFLEMSPSEGRPRLRELGRQIAEIMAAR